MKLERNNHSFVRENGLDLYGPQKEELRSTLIKVILKGKSALVIRGLSGQSQCKVS